MKDPILAALETIQDEIQKRYGLDVQIFIKAFDAHQEINKEKAEEFVTGLSHLLGKEIEHGENQGVRWIATSSALSSYNPTDVEVTAFYSEVQ